MVMTIDPRHLAHLLAIARHGSFNRAADALNLSQPALSKSIALLERRLGARVIERGPRGSALTPAGEILVRRARGLETLVADAEREVRLNAAGAAGPLAIGATPSAVLRLVPDALARLAAAGERIEVSVVEGLDGTLLPALADGGIDIMVGPVGGLYPAGPDVVEEALIEDPFSLGVGPSHPLAGRASLSLAELAEAAWVLPLPGSAYHRHVEALFMTAGVPWPTDRIGSNSLGMTERLVRETGRVAIITRLQVLADQAAPLRAVPLAGAGSRRVGYRLRRGSEPSPLARRFIAALRAAAGAIT